MVAGTPDYFYVYREKGVQTRVHYRFGVLPANTTELLCDWKGQDVSLEHLELSCNHESYVRLLLKPYKLDGTLDESFGMIGKSGVSWEFISPKAIHDNQSIMWLELVYETGAYKFGLGYPTRFCNGVRIEIWNSSFLNDYMCACEAGIVVRGM